MRYTAKGALVQDNRTGADVMLVPLFASATAMISCKPTVKSGMVKLEELLLAWKRSTVST